MHLVHATSVEIDGHAVLIRGPSGGGKSDLALRLIDAGAMLVADDQTAITIDGGRLFAGVPETIAGLLEVRGLGIIRVPYRPKDVERLPEPSSAQLLGVMVPRVALAAFEASTPAKVRLAMLSATRDIMRP